MHVESRGLLSHSTSILKAKPSKHDIKGYQIPSVLFISLSIGTLQNGDYDLIVGFRVIQHHRLIQKVQHHIDLIKIHAQR